MENDNNNMVSTTETVENNVEENTQNVQSEVKEKDNWTKEHRDELNRMFASERQKEREKVMNEMKAKQDEANRLAKMDEDQKRTYELEQANKRALTAESELNAYKLKDEAIKQASAKGVDLELMQTIDYSKETAESISKKIEIFERTSKKIHENAISEYSKEPTPQTGDSINLDSNKTGYEKFEEKYQR